MINKNIMVCVTQQKTCERLIKKGYKLKQAGEGNLYIINVVHKNDTFLHKSNEPKALEYLFRVAEKSDAELMVIKTENVIQSMIDFANENNITDIVMGKSPNFSNENHPIASKLQRKLNDTNYIII